MLKQISLYGGPRSPNEDLAPLEHFSEENSFWSGRDLSNPSQKVVGGVVLCVWTRGIGMHSSLHDLDLAMKVVSFGCRKIGDLPNFESRFPPTQIL